MITDFRTALARLVPVFMPELLFRLGADGQPVFKDFAAAIVPTEFMPGKVFESGAMQPIDYCIELAEGRIAPPANLDIATIQHKEPAMAFRFHLPEYLSRRVADWKQRGFTEMLTDFRRLNARSKFWGDDHRGAFCNREEVQDTRNPLDQRQGVNERIMLRESLRRVDMMVILEKAWAHRYGCTRRCRPARSEAPTRRDNRTICCRSRCMARTPVSARC